MSRILWSDTAKADLQGVADYFSQFDPDLPYRLIQRIERTSLILLDHPRLGTRTRRQNVRRWPVRKTPFVLFYRVLGTDIEVVHVSHNRMDDR